jgi:hypothetical protein
VQPAPYRRAEADQVEAPGRAHDARRAPAGGGGGSGQLTVEVELEDGRAGERRARGAERGRGEGGGAEAESLAAGGLTVRHGDSKHGGSAKGPFPAR